MSQPTTCRENSGWLPRHERSLGTTGVQPDGVVVDEFTLGGTGRRKRQPARQVASLHQPRPCFPSHLAMRLTEAPRTLPC